MTDKKFQKRMAKYQAEYEDVCNKNYKNKCVGCPMEGKYPCNVGFFYLKGMERGRMGKKK